MNKSVKLLVKQARQQGWRVEVGGGGHIAYHNPEGGVVFGPATPSDYRALKNCKAKLRHAGLQLDEKVAVKKRSKSPRPHPRLPRADLRKIYAHAASYNLARSDINALVRTQFDVNKTSLVPRRAIKTLLTAITAEGKKRRAAAAEQAAAKQLAQELAATPEAKRGEQERERIRAIRQAKKSNRNNTRLDARRAKRRGKRRKR